MVEELVDCPLVVGMPSVFERGDRPSGAIRKSAGSPKRPPVGLTGPSPPRVVLRFLIAARSAAIAARKALPLRSALGLRSTPSVPVVWIRVR